MRKLLMALIAFGSAAIVKADVYRYIESRPSLQRGTTVYIERLNISNGGEDAVIIGANNNSSARTNATQKRMRIAAPPYLSTQAAVTAMFVTVDTTPVGATLNLGGGSIGLLPVNKIDFYTGANSFDVVGTRRGGISNMGYVTFTGSMTVTGGLVGVTDGGNAGAGLIGECVPTGCSSTTASGGVNLTSGRYIDVISTLTLTAGEWEIRGQGNFIPNGATFSSVQTEICVGATSPGDTVAGCTDGLNYLYTNAAFPTSFLSASMSIPPYTLKLTGNQSIFMKAYISTVTGGTAKFRGGMYARRVR